jgi:hypothetical protein
LGSTSVASIEREWSLTSMIDARSTGTVTVFCGLAIAIVSTASAVSARTSGTWRRHERAPAPASASDGAAGKRIAKRRERRRAANVAASSSGISSRPSRKMGEAKPLR